MEISTIPISAAFQLTERDVIFDVHRLLIWIGVVPRRIFDDCV